MECVCFFLVKYECLLIVVSSIQKCNACLHSVNDEIKNENNRTLKIGPCVLVLLYVESVLELSYTMAAVYYCTYVSIVRLDPSTMCVTTVLYSYYVLYSLYTGGTNKRKVSNHNQRLLDQYYRYAPESSHTHYYSHPPLIYINLSLSLSLSSPTITKSIKQCHCQ